MLNKERHQLIMGQVLRDIYNDAFLAPLLGFKGGTCARFFYGLPRFSVDLDFDLLVDNTITSNEILVKVENILKKYGIVKERHVKKHTIFLLLSYGEADRNIKVEVNTRLFAPNVKEHYTLEEYLGIPMMIAKRGYMFANKLAALTLRRKTAMRDVYDIWYFSKNTWDIDTEILKIRTGKTVKEYLNDCIGVIVRIKDSEILQGLGELLNEKEKNWVKNNLRSEAIFLLKNYLTVFGASQTMG